MFDYQELPAIGEQAMELTEHALDRLVDIAEEQGFDLLVVAEPVLTNLSGQELGEGRRLARGAVERVESIAQERQLPFLDLYPHFASKGPLSEARWRYDGHWNQEGHRRAADGIFEFLVANPELLR